MLVEKGIECYGGPIDGLRVVLEPHQTTYTQEETIRNTDTNVVTVTAQHNYELGFSPIKTNKPVLRYRGCVQM